MLCIKSFLISGWHSSCTKESVKIIIITSDLVLVKTADVVAEVYGAELIVNSNIIKPLDVVENIYETNPSLVILDDDLVGTESANLISTLNRIKKNLKIIFVTSDSSIELGKKISQLGVLFYFIKPVVQIELNELLSSINNSKNKIGATTHQ